MDKSRSEKLNRSSKIDRSREQRAQIRAKIIHDRQEDRERELAAAKELEKLDLKDPETETEDEGV
jgi:hypothetical protein